jgi:hypothetical protein
MAQNGASHGIFDVCGDANVYGAYVSPSCDSRLYISVDIVVNSTIEIIVPPPTKARLARAAPARRISLCWVLGFGIIGGGPPGLGSASLWQVLVDVADHL